MSSADKLMKSLWKQEKEDRRNLHRQFRGAYSEYLKRMGGPGDYFHSIPDDSGLGGTVVINNDRRGHDSFVYLSTFTEFNQSSDVSLRTLRSFALGSVYFSIRWRFLSERLYNSGDTENEFYSSTIKEGPTSNISSRSLYGGRGSRYDQDRRFRSYMSFTPETHWHPVPGEQIEVRGMIQQAIGEIMMLGYEDDVMPLTLDVRTLHGLK